jgi:hypothetical protein
VEYGACTSCGAPTDPDSAKNGTTRSVRPPRGVVILRPSELHPDAPSPLGRRKPDRALAPRRETTRTPVPMFSAESTEDVAYPLPPADPWPVGSRQPAVARRSQPLPPPRDRGRSLMWGLKVVVGVALGVLVGFAVPFLLLR